MARVVASILDGGGILRNSIEKGAQIRMERDTCSVLRVDTSESSTVNGLNTFNVNITLALGTALFRGVSSGMRGVYLKTHTLPQERYSFP